MALITGTVVARVEGLAHDGGETLDIHLVSGHSVGFREHGPSVIARALTVVDRPGILHLVDEAKGRALDDGNTPHLVDGFEEFAGLTLAQVVDPSARPMGPGAAPAPSP